MGNSITIPVEKRELLGTANARRMRRNHIIPAVLYGNADTNVNLAIAESDAEKIAYHTGMVTLKCSCGSVKNAIVKEVQRHIISNQILNMDLLEVNANEAIVTLVPVQPVGEPEGLKQGGQLEQIVHEIHIECLPTMVPEVIKVDVSALEVDGALHLNELPLEEGLKAVGEDDTIIFQVRIPRGNLEEEEPAEGEAEAAEGEAEAAK